MKQVLLVMTVALVAGIASADTVVFSQSDFAADLTTEGWTRSTTAVHGETDPDGQSAMLLGFSGRVENVQKSTGITVAAGETYYVQFDVRMTATYSGYDGWTNADPNNRTLTYIFRDPSNTNLTNDTHSINALLSETQWVTVRREYEAVDFGVGEALTLRFWKGDFGAGEEAIWVDNIQVGLVPEPATMSLLALGGVAMLRRRKK